MPELVSGHASEREPDPVDFAALGLAQMYYVIERRLADTVAAGTTDALGAITHIAVQSRTRSRVRQHQPWQDRCGRFASDRRHRPGRARGRSDPVRPRSGAVRGRRPHRFHLPRRRPRQQTPAGPSSPAVAHTELGIASMASYRLYFEDDNRLASLNLYSRQLRRLR